jgi:hypothetical protein
MYISLGALIAVAWVTYCLFPTIETWFSDRREMKEIDRKQREFGRQHRYDDRYQCWVRKADEAVACYDGDGDIFYCYRDNNGLAVIAAPLRPSISASEDVR